MINVPPTPDHAEVDLGTAAGVTDRGLRHQRNEDAMALESEQTPDGLVVVAVVCDGVSSSPRPDEASLAAAQAALPVLLEAVQSGGDLAEASRAAVVAGRQSVAELGEPEGERSATTFLSVVAARGDMTVCWLGDSRAYWLAPTESESVQLTRDDSVAGGMVEAGLASEETAMALPHAHVLTTTAAMRILEPFSKGDPDQGFLRTFAEALTSTGELDRARDILARLPLDQSETASRIFDLADRYLAAHKDDEAVALLQKVQDQMSAAHREGDFVGRLEVLSDAHTDSIAFAEFCAGAYAKLNRETKYFDALVRLFDLHIADGDVEHASETFEMLVDIDPYDARNQKRFTQIEAKADPAFASRMRTRLGQTAPQKLDAGPVETPSASTPRSEQQEAAPTFDDLMVQAEIFLQYSLQSKAVERLQKIAELFPGEEGQNQRLRKLYESANWWPESSAKPQAAPAERPASPAAPPSAESADNVRDLAKISEISRALFRLPSARAILSAGINEIGTHLRVTRCIAVIGPPGKPPELASEFCAPNVEPANGALLVKLLSQLDRAAPDALGGLPLHAAAAPVLRELGLESVLGIVLMDREKQSQAGMVVAGYALPHQWRAHETYFLQAVGDQILLGVNHTRLRTLTRTMGPADEKTGLLARSSYQGMLLSEANRAKSNGIALALALIQIDRGSEVLRQQGEIQLERYVELLARAFQALIRQTDLAIKYTAWTIAFILPDTGLSGAQILAEKLRKAAGHIAPPWNGGVPLSFSASVAEAVARPDYDSEDIVTELINRAEAGLEEAHGRGGDVVIASRLRGR